MNDKTVKLYRDYVFSLRLSAEEREKLFQLTYIRRSESKGELVRTLIREEFARQMGEKVDENI